MDDIPHDTTPQTNEEKKRNLLELFRYNAILSALFFLASTFYLSGQLTDYSFGKYTISEMSHFLNPNQLTFFNLAFIIKSLLDLSFTFYVFKKFELKLNAFTSVVWLIAVLSFGLIGFFPVHQFFVIHWILAISLFTFWTISEYVFAQITKSDSFIYLTNNIIVSQITVVLFSLAIGQKTAMFEIAYFILALFWQIVFISRHLK
jgi:hypothetical protein